MEHLILELREALVHYEKCFDVDAAEHIMANSLVNLHQKCIAVAQRCNEMIEAM